MEKQNKLSDRILCLIEARPGLSLVELLRYLPETAGDREMGFWNLKIVLWRGLSTETVGALRELIQDGKVQISSCPAAVYAIDGGFPDDLPIAKKMRAHETPHWMPVTFSSAGFPPCDLSEGMRPTVAVDRMEELNHD